MSDVEQTQTTDTAPVTMMLGDKLKQARLNKGLSVGEVAERLKLAVSQVEAMETNDPSRFTEPVFARGFFRSYARFLQLNEAEVIADLNEMFPSERVAVNHAQQVHQQAPVRNGGSAKKLPKWLWMAGLVVVIVGVAIAWPKGEADEAVASDEAPLAVGELAAPQVAPVEPVVPVGAVEAEEGTAEATAADAAAAETEANAPAVAGTDVLVVNIASRSMLVVKSKDGEVLMNQIVPARSEHKFEGGAPYDVRIGYARGASMTFNDEAVDLSGAFVDKITAAVTVPK
ncbi:helix-turn-helix domain-containing protein [Neisseriaceae bacterium CLB008]